MAMPTEVTVRVTIGIWSPTWNFAVSFSTTTSDGDDSTCTSVTPSKALMMTSGLAVLPRMKLKPGAAWPIAVVSPLKRVAAPLSSKPSREPLRKNWTP